MNFHKIVRLLDGNLKVYGRDSSGIKVCIDVKKSNKARIIPQAEKFTKFDLQDLETFGRVDGEFIYLDSEPSAFVESVKGFCDVFLPRDSPSVSLRDADVKMFTDVSLMKISSLADEEDVDVIVCEGAKPCSPCDVSVVSINTMIDLVIPGNRSIDEACELLGLDEGPRCEMIINLFMKLLPDAVRIMSMASGDFDSILSSECWRDVVEPFDWTLARSILVKKIENKTLIPGFYREINAGYLSEELWKCMNSSSCEETRRLALYLEPLKFMSGIIKDIYCISDVRANRFVHSGIGVIDDMYLTDEVIESPIYSWDFVAVVSRSNFWGLGSSCSMFGRFPYSLDMFPSLRTAMYQCIDILHQGGNDFSRVSKSCYLDVVTTKLDRGGWFDENGLRTFDHSKASMERCRETIDSSIRSFMS